MSSIDNNRSISTTDERSVAIDLTPANNTNTIRFSSSCTPIIATPTHLEIIEERRERGEVVLKRNFNSSENSIHFRS
jgi:hypothetical protein